MKRISFAFSVVVLIFGVAVQAQTQSESAEQELIRLTNSWANAIIKDDVDFIDQIMADDFIEVNEDGLLSNKAECLANMKSPNREVVLNSIVIDEIKVKVYGEAALVIGLQTVKFQSKGRDLSAQWRFADTWIKIAGRWQCVITTGTMIPQK